MPSKLKANRNYKYVASMLPREHTDRMERIVSTSLDAEFLIFPNRIVFSYPISIRLPKGTGRDVKQRLDRELKVIEMEYKPRYTLDSFNGCAHVKEIVSADLEAEQPVDQEYVNTVNLLWYLGHRCDKCSGYRTDVGFDEETNFVYQCLECGDIVIDTTQTISVPGWVTNLMGGDKD